MESTTKPPAQRIFVVGMNGSGTTMLLDHLSHHSLVYGFVAETRILPYFLDVVGKYGDLEVDSNLKKLWEDMCGSFPFWKANRRAPVPLPDDWNLRERNPAEIFDYLMLYFTARAGKQVWCEKTPMYALHLRVLSECFPDARFIHVIRDGRDSAASFHRRYGYDPASTIYRWKKVVQAARDQGHDIPDRYIEVMYDDVTCDPEGVLRRICSFLDLAYEDQLLTSRRATPRALMKESNEIVPNSGRFKEHFSAKQVAKLESIAGRVLYEFGFDPEDKHGDRDVNPLYLRTRQALTHIRLGIEEVPYRLRSGAKHPWKTILGRFKSSWRQRKTNRF